MATAIGRTQLRPATLLDNLASQQGLKGSKLAPVVVEAAVCNRSSRLSSREQKLLRTTSSGVIIRILLYQLMIRDWQQVHSLPLWTESLWLETQTKMKSEFLLKTSQKPNLKNWGPRACLIKKSARNCNKSINSTKMYSSRNTKTTSTCRREMRSTSATRWR